MNKETEAQISILTQNLRCGYIRDERDGRENMIRWRQFRFKKLLEKYDPDIVGLQEVTTGWLGLLEDGVMDDYTIVHKWRKPGTALIIPGETDLETTPIAYKTAKFNELDRGYFWLSETPDRWSPCYEPKKAPRIVCWVYLEEKKSGARIYAASTHFPPGHSEGVIKSGKQLARWFHTLPQEAYAFYMGDLNMPYGAGAYHEFAHDPEAKDLRTVAEEMAADGLCTMGELRRGTYNKFIYEDGLYFIDHIFARSKPHMAVDFYGVLYDQIGMPERKVTEGYVSDHFAVLTKLRLNTEEDYSKYYEHKEPYYVFKE